MVSVTVPLAISTVDTVFTLFLLLSPFKTVSVNAFLLKPFTSNVPPLFFFKLPVIPLDGFRFEAEIF